MEYLKQLYKGASIKKNDSWLIRTLEKRKPDPLLYVLTVATNEKDQIDLYPAVVFRQKNPILDELLVIGFSRGKFEGISVIRELTQKVVSETGEAKLRSYLLQQERR